MVVRHIPAFSASDVQSALAHSLGVRLAARRKVLHLTQVDLAEKVGVDVETISRFERGKHLPSLITLKTLAVHLGCSVASLLGEDEMSAMEGLSQLAPAFALLSQEDRNYAMLALHGLCVHLTKRVR